MKFMKISIFGFILIFILSLFNLNAQGTLRSRSIRRREPLPSRSRSAPERNARFSRGPRDSAPPSRNIRRPSRSLDMDRRRSSGPRERPSRSISRNSTVENVITSRRRPDSSVRTRALRSDILDRSDRARSAVRDPGVSIINGGKRSEIRLGRESVSSRRDISDTHESRTTFSFQRNRPDRQVWLNRRTLESRHGRPEISEHPHSFRDNETRRRNLPDLSRTYGSIEHRHSNIPRIHPPMEKPAKVAHYSHRERTDFHSPAQAYRRPLHRGVTTHHHPRPPRSPRIYDAFDWSVSYYGDDYSLFFDIGYYWDPFWELDCLVTGTTDTYFSLTRITDSSSYYVPTTKYYRVWVSGYWKTVTERESYIDYYGVKRWKTVTRRIWRPGRWEWRIWGQTL